MLKKKQKILLKWILTDENVTKALQINYIIDDIELLTQQDKLNSGILENDVQMDMIKCFFTVGIWKSFLKIINIKRKKVT